MRRIVILLAPFVLVGGGLAACGTGETSPTPSSTAAVATPNSGTPGEKEPWLAPDASAKCKLMGRYSEQLDKVSSADSMRDPAEFKKLVPEFAEMKKIAEEAQAAGMRDPLGTKFVELNGAMLKLAEEGDLEAFQSASFLDEEMGKAIDELGTWCN